MADHDHSYKLLFSHPEMVRDLLEGFVKADWLAGLDYTSLEKVSGSYVTDDLRDRASDIVWLARWGREWIYIYLLIEFQSTIDRYMAVRVLTYLGLLYQDLIRSRQVSPDGGLPPVLPIVLYNGAPRWNAAEQVEALIHPGPKGLEHYRPRLRYLLIDEGRYSESELAPLKNLVAALFRLESSRSRADVDRVLANLVEWLKRPEQRNLNRALAEWMGRVILAKLPGAPVSGLDDLQEMRKMLADRIEEWGEEFKREGLRKGLEEGRQRGLEEGRQRGVEEGRQRGVEEGRQEGRQEGEARLLLRQLRKRFGELPDWVPSRLQQANPEQLERWGECLLEIDSLSRLFDPE